MRACALPLACLFGALASYGCDGGTSAPADASAGSDARAPDASVDASADAPADVAAIDGASLVQGLTIAESPRSVLAYRVIWLTPEPATSELSVDCGEPLQTARALEGMRTMHELFVMGLAPETSCVFEVCSTTVDAARGCVERTVDVGTLPSTLPSFTVEVHDEAATQPGWTLVNLNNARERMPLSIALFDQQGRIRWYREVGGGWGIDNETELVAEGVMLGPAGGHDPAIYSWNGTELWSQDVIGHHDIVRYPGSAHVTYPVFEGDCGTGINAGGFDRLDLETGEVEWSWRICAHVTPPTLEPDWAHINTFVPVPGQDAFLVSARNLNQLLKVDEATGDVIWRLGEGGDFTMADEDLFYWQHAPEILPSGNILLFDNGREGVREVSRAIELSVDETAMTAEVVWEFVPDAGHFTPTWGDADRLDNGNTLATFGERTAGEFAHLIEVDADARPVWDVRYEASWASYRADRVAIPRLIWLADELPTGLEP